MNENERKQARKWIAMGRSLRKEEKYRIRKDTKSYSILMLCDELGIEYTDNSRYSNVITLNDHDSCKIWKDKNTFKRFSKSDVGGDVVAFLHEFGEEYTGNKYFNNYEYCMFYLNANMSKDKQLDLEVLQKKAREKPKVLELPERARHNNYVINYLRDERHIDPDIIKEWIDNGNCYQSVFRYTDNDGYTKTFNNCVFIALDEKGKPYQGMQRSTFGSMKRDLNGNDYSKAFFIRNKNSPYNKNLVVTEAVIDAMSIQTLYKHNLHFTESHYVSLNGVSKYEGLLNLIKENTYIKEITLCLDNDDAGRKASKDIKQLIRTEINRDMHIYDKPFEIYGKDLTKENVKDWNEALIYVDKNNIQDIYKPQEQQNVSIKKKELGHSL